MGYNRFSLTEEQQVAVKEFDRPLSILAGAGSGKTRVLVERYLALLSRGTEPSRILAVTFTNEAADELRHRITDSLRAAEAPSVLVTDVENSPWMGTIHSFCYRLLEQYASVLGMVPVNTITDDFELTERFYSKYEEWFSKLTDKSLDGLLTYFNSSDLFEIAELVFLSHFHFKNALQLVKPGEDLGNKMLLRLDQLLEPLVTSVQSELHGIGSYTFNDLETYSFRLLSQSECTKQRLGQQFDYILIDEFQDTTRLQWAVLKEILGSDLKKLFIVGDPKQSVYGFRHSDVRLFQEVNHWITESGGTVQQLSLNFRTDANLLESINASSERLFDLSVVPFHAMRPAKGDTDAQNSIQFVEYPVGTASSRIEAQELEKSAVVQAVSALRHAGASANEIAVLFRNSDRMKDYSEALLAKGISTYTEINLSLFDNYDTRDLTAFLQAFEDPLDDFALSAFLRSRYVDLSFTELALLVAEQREKVESLFGTLVRKPDPAYRWFVELIESGKTSVSQALETLFGCTGQFPHFLDGMMTLLKPLLKSNDTSTAIRNLKLWQQRGISIHQTLGSRENGVRLMTVHSAKGLEFSHVLLADALRQPPQRQPTLLINPGQPAGLKYRTEGGFSYSQSYETLWAFLKGQEEEEAKRILYVALTRAKKSLHVFLPKGMKRLPKGSWAALFCENVLQGDTVHGEENSLPLPELSTLPLET